MKRICNHEVLKLINGKRRTPHDISTVRKVDVSALGKLDFWVHAGFYLLGLSADDREPALRPLQKNLLQRESEGNWGG